MLSQTLFGCVWEGVSWQTEESRRPSQCGSPHTVHWDLAGTEGSGGKQSPCLPVFHLSRTLAQAYTIHLPASDFSASVMARAVVCTHAHRPSHHRGSFSAGSDLRHDPLGPLSPRAMSVNISGCMSLRPAVSCPPGRAGPLPGSSWWSPAGREEGRRIGDLECH